MSLRHRSSLAALLTGVLVLGAAATAQAQSFRLTGSTSMRYVEVRPLVRDSVSVEETEGDALLRVTAEGRVVRCVPGEAVCRGTRPADAVSTVPIIQDLEMSAWGFGEGVRIFAHLRGRTSWGSRDELWPQSDDPFDLLVAFGEVDRASYRVRAGRQWKVSGLGVYNFDGVSGMLRPRPGVSLEAYAGRSLIRGLNESQASDALQSIEPLAQEEPGLLLGLHGRYRPTPGVGLGVFYQREVRADEAGLYGERAGADGVVRIGGGSIEGALEGDLVESAVNEARVVLRSPRVGPVVLHAEGRLHRPYFELWTIWGAFSPVGFDEVRAGATGAALGGELLLRGEAQARRYEDLGNDPGLGDFRRDGWGAGASANWSPRGLWSVDGSYRIEVGFGAARSEGHVGAVRSLGELGTVAARALAFQRVYEFRLDEGTVVGLGADAALRVSPRANVFAGLAAYRHLNGGDTPDVDWNQLRANLRLQWTVGEEPRDVLVPAVRP